MDFLMAFAGNLNIHLGFPMCQPRSSSQSVKRTHQGPRALMLIFLATCPLAWPRSLFLLLWVPEPMLCQQHWWLVLSQFSHYILLLRFPSKKFQAGLSHLGGPRGWFLISFSKASKEAFQNPPFWLPHPLSFFSK